MGAGGSDRIARWVRPEVRALSSYGVPAASGLIKLDAMENPYPWPGKLVDAWLEELRKISVNRYPDPSAPLLRQALAETLGLPAGMEILLGNGSDELIQLLTLPLAAPGRVVLAPEPTFVMYRRVAIAAGMEYVGVPLQGADFALDREAMLRALARYQPALVFLAYPNNPTGNLFDAQTVRAIIEAAPGLVVVDEAYAPFAETSLMGYLEAYPHFFLLRTLSKLGLAGLRLGLLVGAPAWLAEFDKLRLPYNINALTQASAVFALAHYDVLQAQAAQIRQERELLREALEGFPALAVWPSRANFLLLRVPQGRAEAIFAGLRSHGILIKNLHGSSPLLVDCLRITVGRPEENQALVQAFREVL